MKPWLADARHFGIQTCKLATPLLAVLPRALLPAYYVNIVSEFNLSQIPDNMYHKEINFHVMSIPELSLESPTLKSIEEELNKVVHDEDELEAFSGRALDIFLLAIYDPTVEGLTLFRSGRGLADIPSESLRIFFQSIIASILEQLDNTRILIARFFRSLIYHELYDRYERIQDVIDLPVYMPSIFETIVVASMHYYPEFLPGYQSLLKELISVQNMQKIARIVSLDVTLFCLALLRLPPRFHACRRFEQQIWKKDEDIHPEAGRWLLAFCSKYPIEVFRVMDWCVSPYERNQLHRLSRGGFTITRKELQSIFLNGGT